MHSFAPDAPDLTQFLGNPWATHPVANAIIEPMPDEQPTTRRDPDLLTVPEVAKFLRLSPTSVYRLIERRDLPFYRTSQKILFLLTDVEEYLKKCRIEPFEEPVPRRKPNLVQ